MRRCPPAPGTHSTAFRKGPTLVCHEAGVLDGRGQLGVVQGMPVVQLWLVALHAGQHLINTTKAGVLDSSLHSKIAIFLPSVASCGLTVCSVLAH